MDNDKGAIYQNIPPDYGDPAWLAKDRFGLFIHWGLYAVAARHEWVMNHEKIHPDTYRKYFEHFDPDLYNPEHWAKVAKETGMKYVVITTKHHEGFALWDSELTEYKSTNTPAQKDLLRPFVEAFRREGFKIGFYHSLIDWHHPEFPVDGLHPQRDDEEFKKNNQQRNINKYREFLHGQVKELLTNYGKIDYMWFDFSYPDRDWGWAKGKGSDDWGAEDLERMILKLQPHIILNDRLDLGHGVTTPEQFLPKEGQKDNEKPVLWEACQTLNGSWGYDRDNLNWKSVDMLIKMLVDSVSKGGNLLLNVGPNGRGTLEERALETLMGIGKWMGTHSCSIYGAAQSDFKAPSDCRYTQKGNRLYLHIFSWPFRNIYLKDLAGKIEYAQLLHDGSEILFNEYEKSNIFHHNIPEVEPGDVMLQLPVQKPDTSVPVIELVLKD